MTLRRPKAVENLRLANLRDYIITEDDGKLSPFSPAPEKPGRIIPRRVNEDSSEDIVTSFRKFKWHEPKIDGIVLCNYRRFVNAMKVPTKQAIEPWVEWVERQLGWERTWILENPVATKREVMRRFKENDDRMVDMLIPQGENVALAASSHRLDTQESIDSFRKGAVSRFGFRDEMNSSKRSTSTPRSRISLWQAINRENEEDETSTMMLERKPARSTSALGFREVRRWKGQLSSLKKKALTNPWSKRSHAAK